MGQVNVVGQPDNAAKGSRERIKAALKNRGFEFPYGQGVTINLAPPDIRKEGSAFDLPMALRIDGVQRGSFFGKPLDKMMLLGELSMEADSSAQCAECGPLGKRIASDGGAEFECPGRRWSSAAQSLPG